MDSSIVKLRQSMLKKKWMDFNIVKNPSEELDLIIRFILGLDDGSVVTTLVVATIDVSVVDDIVLITKLFRLIISCNV